MPSEPLYASFRWLAGRLVSHTSGSILVWRFWDRQFRSHVSRRRKFRHGAVVRHQRGEQGRRDREVEILATRYGGHRDADHFSISIHDRAAAASGRYGGGDLDPTFIPHFAEMHSTNDARRDRAFEPDRIPKNEDLFANFYLAHVRQIQRRPVGSDEFQKNEVIRLIDPDRALDDVRLSFADDLCESEGRIFDNVIIGCHDVRTNKESAAESKGPVHGVLKIEHDDRRKRLLRNGSRVLRFDQKEMRRNYSDYYNEF
jgi:hypothetical protein